MEIYPKYSFAAEEIRIANIYNAVYQEKLAHNSGFASAEIAAESAVLKNVVNSEENVRTSGGAFRNAKKLIEWGIPHEVARMYEEAYADNTTFDTLVSSE